MIQIILSTYNGAAYLEPLLKSLLAQDYPYLEILIRDDGSTDGTITILKEYSRYQNIKVVYGKNIGFYQSFFQLIDMASTTAEYLAFCDQDDVWYPNKISEAIKHLQKYPQSVPLLYGSRAILVDENLKLLGYTEIPQKKLSFANALVECTILGCTSLFNQETRKVLLGKDPQYVYGHDWWLYLVVAAFGTVIYDCEPKILYRQHHNNVYGMSHVIIEKFKVMVNRFLTQGHQQLVVKQAKEFKRVYYPLLSQDKQRILDNFLKTRWSVRRLSYTLFGDVYRQSPLDNFILKILLILNQL